MLSEPAPAGRALNIKEEWTIEAPYQTYLDNLKTAFGLLKPALDSGYSEEKIIEVIRDNAEKTFRIHRENDEILQKILFSQTEQTLTPYQAEQLSQLADQLFSFQRSPDVGIAHYIHKLLYAYARYRQDRDLMVRELYFLGVTLMYMNVSHAQLGTDLYVEQIGAYFREGASFLDQYDELKNQETRAYIIRCLGNIKHGIRNRAKDSRAFDINNDWDDYMKVFEKTMSIVQSPRYRQMDPEIPWDNFIYSMHYDRTKFLSGLRERNDPAIAAAVLESAVYVYQHQEQIAKVRDRTVGVRTQYVYQAARYHAGIATLDELTEALFQICEEADLHDFSGDNIWAVLMTPEYLMSYLRFYPRERQEELRPRMVKVIDRQKEYLFLLPKNEYTLQVSQTLQAIANFIPEKDDRFSQRILHYILACHPPTFIHSQVVAALTKRLCGEMAEKKPELLQGAFGILRAEEHLPELLQKAYLSGLYHDLGKCMLLNYVGQYNRRLLDEEFDCIRLHTIFGCDLLEGLDMQDFSNAAYYHHCAYNGLGGYPKPERECPGEVRRIVDIITVVDSLDAGTDDVGRSYAAAKTYEQLVEELRAGKGTRYAPEVVALFDDPAFFEETKAFLLKTRKQAYLNAYAGGR